MSRRKGRHPKGVGFTRYRASMLTDPDFIALPPTARVIFFDMCRIHRHGGKVGGLSNNGTIGYGCSQGGRAAGVSAMQAHRMLKILQDGGWIVLRRPGVFKGIGGLGSVSEWEIAIFPTTGRMAKKRFPGEREMY